MRIAGGSAKWLEETMVSLFDASFGYVDRAAFEAAETGKDLSEYKELALDAHGAQLQALTRLRFLANPEVLELAFELHDIEDRLYSIVFTEPFEPGEWQKLQDQQREFVRSCSTRVAGT